VDTFAGVGTRFTESDSQNVDPDDPETWKQCVFVDCPDQQPVAEISALYTCVEYAHFTFKAYPEYVNLFIQKALQAHVLKNSLTLLADVEAQAEVVPGIQAVPNTVNGFFNALDIQFSAYRDAFWLDRTQVIDIVQPRWVLNMLRHALANRTKENELAAIRTADSVLQGLYASVYLRVNFVDGYERLAVSTDGDGITNTPIVPLAGTNLWPSTVPTLAWVPGSVVRLVDPSWNIGLERLRDTALQRRNAYSLFMETFDGLAYPCPYPIQSFDLEFCPAGTAFADESLNCATLVGESA
jgi:hypothetical protein